MQKQDTEVLPSAITARTDSQATIHVSDEDEAVDITTEDDEQKEKKKRKREDSLPFSKGDLRDTLLEAIRAIKRHEKENQELKEALSASQNRSQKYSNKEIHDTLTGGIEIIDRYKEENKELQEAFTASQNHCRLLSKLVFALSLRNKLPTGVLQVRGGGTSFCAVDLPTGQLTFGMDAGDHVLPDFLGDWTHQLNYSDALKDGVGDTFMGDLLEMMIPQHRIRVERFLLDTLEAFKSNNLS